jgi:hypothetical protein
VAAAGSRTSWAKAGAFALGGPVALFPMCGYQGWSVVFGVGIYGASAMSRQGIQNGALSGATVAPGYALLLIWGGVLAAGGPALLLTGNLPCLSSLVDPVRGSWDGACSAVIIMHASSYVVAACNAGPWGQQNCLAGHSPSWIWNDIGAASNAAVNTRATAITFVKVVAGPAQGMSVDMHVIVDNHADVYLNGLLLVPDANGGWNGSPHATIRAARLNPGSNVVMCRAWNDGGPAGLLVVMVQSGTTTLVMETGASWGWTTGWDPSIVNASPS